MAAGGAIPAFESTAISLSRLSLRVPELMTRQTDLARWPIFSILPEDVVNSIRKICVFGSSGNEAIFITASDDVYAIGSNCSSCLGLGELLFLFLLDCLFICLFVCLLLLLFFLFCIKSCRSRIYFESLFHCCCCFKFI